MTQKELELILNRIDAMQDQLTRLDSFIRDHMANEEKALHEVDKRISKLEWGAGVAGIIFGVIGGALGSKIRAIFGVDNP